MISTSIAGQGILVIEYGMLTSCVMPSLHPERDVVFSMSFLWRKSEEQGKFGTITNLKVLSLIGNDCSQNIGHENHVHRLASHKYVFYECVVGVGILGGLYKLFDRTLDRSS